MATKTVTALNKEIENFLHKRGVIRVGFATLETLAGGPPSTDLTYVLPEAKSAISFAMPLDLDNIRDFLAKKEGSQAKVEEEDLGLNEKLSQIGHELAKWLEDKGFKAYAPLRNNNIYRTEMKRWRIDMPPDISHRYVAVRSGVGTIGWSGNIGIEEFGSNILLNTVVTDAELSPTDPLPLEESFCGEKSGKFKCKMCVAACCARFFDAKETDEVNMGGQTFSYSARHHRYRCQLVCGGFSGLHSSKKWSTYSPGRFELPGGDEEKILVKTLAQSAMGFMMWPEWKPPGGFYNPIVGEVKKIRLTCGNCQKVCMGSEEENKKAFKILQNSGCAIQKPDGEVVVLPPDEAQELFDSFPRKHRKLYTNIQKKN